MTKVRDIATFLGKTEAFNSTNKRLAFDSNEVTTLTPTIATDIINQYATVIYNTVDSLPANPINGARAWVKANNRFYVADSSWHNTLLVNVPPTINIANYDSVLTDSQSLTMTIQVTDSFENLDIITFGATLSPSNITDSAVLSFSRDSSVVALAINPDSATSNARSFQITFSANDQINLATSVKSFTIDRGFVLTPLSQILSLSGGTIINADSDLAGGVFQLTSGDVLSDSAASLEAIVSESGKPDLLVDDKTVRLGSVVKIQTPKETFKVRLVHPVEAHLDDERISAESPLGQAILGNKKGDRVTVIAPSGNWSALRFCTIFCQVFSI